MRSEVEVAHFEFTVSILFASVPQMRFPEASVSIVLQEVSVATRAPPETTSSPASVDVAVVLKRVVEIPPAKVEVPVPCTIITPVVVEFPETVMPPMIVEDAVEINPPSVGKVPKTTAPLPVSSVRSAASSEDVSISSEKMIDWSRKLRAMDEVEVRFPAPSPKRKFDGVEEPVPPRATESVLNHPIVKVCVLPEDVMVSARLVSGVPVAKVCVAPVCAVEYWAPRAVMPVASVKHVPSAFR